MDFVTRHMVMQEIGEALTRSLNEDPNFATDLDEALDCLHAACEQLPKAGSLTTPKALAAGREAVLELAVTCIRAMEPSRWETPRGAAGKRS